MSTGSLALNWQHPLRIAALMVASLLAAPAAAQEGRDLPLQDFPPLPAQPTVSDQARTLRASLLGPEAADPDYVTLHWVGVASFIVTIGQHLLLFDAWEVIGT